MSADTEDVDQEPRSFYHIDPIMSRVITLSVHLSSTSRDANALHEGARPMSKLKLTYFDVHGGRDPATPHCATPILVASTNGSVESSIWRVAGPRGAWM